jgi:hypothetical protein
MRRFSDMPLYVKLVLVLAAIIIVGAISAGISLATLDRGPAQPIPFSHRIHADTKQINCFFCHPYASESSNAGIPPVEKCLLCHSVVASQFGPIHKIQEYDLRREGIPWVRVNKLPEFVRFNHQCHIAGGHDCGECHGDVKAMDRVRPVKKFDMNYCVTCHRQNKVTVDCYTCHY